MTYIKSSHPLNESLKGLCDVKGIAYLAPELDVKTRWNSTYYMLEKWTKMEAALNLLAADNRAVRQRYPDADDRDSIKDIITILKPFERLLDFFPHPIIRHMATFVLSSLAFKNTYFSIWILNYHQIQ